MELKDVIAIRGKSELFKVLAKTPKGIVVESLSEKKIRFKVQANFQVLMLSDISVFSNDGSDIFLKDVFQNIKAKNGMDLPVHPKTAAVELKSYFTEIVPNHDAEKVYLSDIKKIIKWYETLCEYAPSVIENIDKTEEEESGKEEKTQEPAEEKTPEKDNEPKEEKPKDE
jgi:hypothetical protein